MWSAQWAKTEGIALVSRVVTCDELMKPNIFDRLVPSLVGRVESGSSASGGAISGTQRTSEDVVGEHCIADEVQLHC